MTRLAPRLLLASLGLLAATGAAAAQRPGSRTARLTDDAAERALFRLENDWAQAVIHRDAATLERLVAPRWVYSDESGVMERAAGIRAFTTGTDSVREASNSEMRALVYPGVAVVIGVLRMKGRSPSGPFTHRYRYTDTWAMIDGRWQCIASQDYLMPEPRTVR
jgi:ketosteroid isomerase-like protein